LKVTTVIEHREALAESGYAGAFSVEIEGQLGVKPQLEQVNEAMRQSREFLAALGLG
jgi:sugar phosphate isomerase/epimerase